jgi:glycosyltransferase 2 family protein
MKKYTKWVVSSIFISILSIAAVLFFTLDTTTIEIVRQIRPGYMLAAFLIHLCSFIIWGMRIRVMTSALGYDIGLLRAYEIVVSGTFVAALTPASIGGEPLRIHLLRQDKMPVGKASAVILGERILDALLMLLAAPFSLYLFHSILSSDPSLNLVIILGGFFSVVTLVLILYALMRPRIVKLVINNLVEWLIKRFSGRKIGEKLRRLSVSIDREIDEFHESIYLFATEARSGLIYGIIYTIIYWIVEFASLPAILMGLNQPPSILISFAVQALLLIIIVAPLTPGSSGVAEIAAASLFSVFMPASIIGIAVTGWRAFTFYTNILVGGFVSFKLLKDTEMVKKYLK